MAPIPQSIASMVRKATGSSSSSYTASSSTPSTTSASSLAPNGALRRFHFGLAQRAYSPCDILVIGDSISEGTGATQRTRRWVDQFQKRMREQFPTTGVLGGEGFVKGLYTSGVTFGHGWTYSGNITSNGTFGFGRSIAVLSGSDGAITRTVTGTSIKLLALTNNTTGVAEVRYVTSGGSLPATANATFTTTSGVSTSKVDGTIVVTFPSRGTYDVQIKWKSGGSVNLNGLWVYDGDENAGIRVTESAQHGSTTANWTPGATLSNGSTNQDSVAMTPAITALDPDLVIIGLGGNDRTSNVSVDTYKANLASLIQVIKNACSASIVLLGEYQEGAGTNAWPNYLAAQKSLADNDPTRVYLYSLYDRFPISSDNALTWVHTDGVHPSDRGHATIAEFLASDLRPR